MEKIQMATSLPEHLISCHGGILEKNEKGGG